LMVGRVKEDGGLGVEDDVASTASRRGNL